MQKARELILADLDAKATRVTLKIDIPFSEHSHVIGKEGCNIKKGICMLDIQQQLPDMDMIIYS